MIYVRDIMTKEVATLERGGGDLTPRDLGSEDPVARGVAEMAGLLGASLTTKKTAELLGVDPSRVRQRLAERTLYGFRRAGQWRVPTFQFDQKGLVPGLEELSDSPSIETAVTLSPRRPHGRTLGAVHHPELDRRPIRRPAHHATEGINLPDHRPLRHPTDGRIARHLANGFEIGSDDECPGAQSGRGRGRFRARVPAADDDDIVRNRHGVLN